MAHWHVFFVQEVAIRKTCVAYSLPAGEYLKVSTFIGGGLPNAQRRFYYVELVFSL